ncbi:MAG: hypothetical protein WCL14_08685 [Bacteroidota bacterium]
MPQELKYLVDNKGHKQSVLVPIKTWESLNAKYEKLSKKLEALTGIHKGLNEVREAKKSGKKLSTLKSFLDESNG